MILLHRRTRFTFEKNDKRAGTVAMTQEIFLQNAINGKGMEPNAAHLDSYAVQMMIQLYLLFFWIFFIVFFLY